LSAWPKEDLPAVLLPALKAGGNPLNKDKGQHKGFLIAPPAGGSIGNDQGDIFLKPQNTKLGLEKSLFLVIPAPIYI